MASGWCQAALPAVILCPVEVWTSNVRTTGSASSRGLQSFANTVVLLTLITLCILSRLPKTERQDAIRVRIRDENNFIRKHRLFFQDRYYLVVDRAGKFSCLALFANQFDYP